MRLNPFAHGKTDNLHCSARGQGITFKLILFFNTGKAYVVKSSQKNPELVIDHDKLYNDLVDACDKMDFELVTPRSKIMKHKFGTTQNLLSYIKNL